jgi:hypothetical protein
MSVKYYQNKRHDIPGGITFYGLILFVANLLFLMHIFYFRVSFIAFRIDGSVTYLRTVGRKVCLLPTEIGEDNAET